MVKDFSFRLPNLLLKPHQRLSQTSDRSTPSAVQREFDLSGLCGFKWTVKPAEARAYQIGGELIALRKR